MDQLNPGDILWAFDGAGGKRPFVVISRESLNRGDYFIAVPFTSSRLPERKQLPNCVLFPAGAFGLPRECVAQADAVTQLRRTDLATPLDRIGTLTPGKLADLLRAVGYTISADCAPA